MAELNDLNVTDASNTARFPEGQNPSTVNDGARALEGIIARHHKDTNGSVAVSGTDTYTATINADSGFALYDGFEFVGDFANANTGAATLNLTPDGGSALGAVSIVKNGSTALESGDIPAGGKVGLIYDGTNFQAVKGLNASGYTDPLTTRGDMLRRGASASERVALGADNTIMASDGTDPNWESLTSLLDSAIGNTQGNVLYRDGSNWTVLAPGTSGQFLKTNGAGANPAWADAGGGWEFVSSQTVSSAVAAVEFTGLETGYDYKVVFSDLDPATDNVDGRFRIGTSGPSYLTSSYSGGAGYISGDGTEGVATATTHYRFLGSNQGNSTNEEAHGEITIIDPYTTGPTLMYSIGYKKQSTGDDNSFHGGGQQTSSSQIEAIQFSYSSGNINTGNFWLYRRANS